MINRQRQVPPQMPPQPSSPSSGPSMLALVLAATMCLLIWPGVVGGLALYRFVLQRWPHWWSWVALSVGGASLAALWLFMIQPFQQLAGAFAGLYTRSVLANVVALLPFWAWTLLLAPVLAVGLALFLPRSAADRLRGQFEQNERRLEKTVRQARKQMGQVPIQERQDQAAMGVLGKMVEHPEQPESARLHWGSSRNRWFVLPEGILNMHGVLIGGSGTGKTMTMLRIAALAALYGWKVFYLDAKGDKETAAQFIALMRALGKARVAMFPARAYNGWQGNGAAILNRLMAVQDYSESYYQAVAKRILHVICTEMDRQPPRSSEELFERLEILDAARERYHLDKLKDDTLAGAELRYRAFFSALEGRLDGSSEGWSFDTVDAGYLLLDGLALKEEASSLGRFFMEDFAHFAAVRKDPNEKVLLIVDEFSAISRGGADAANLFERLRSYRAAILASAQSYAGLGDDADRILEACAFIVVHGTPNPDRLIQSAGERLDVAMARQVGVLDQEAGYGTIRVERRSAIDPNSPRRLGTGEAIVISRGRWSHILVAPTKINPLELGRAMFEIEHPRGLPEPELEGGLHTGVTLPNVLPELPAPEDV